MIETISITGKNIKKGWLHAKNHLKRKTIHSGFMMFIKLLKNQNKKSCH